MSALAALKARQKAAKDQFLDGSNRPAGREAQPPAERDPLSDEDEPQVVDDGEGAREEPMMYEDLRAAFPMDFGQQEKKSQALPEVHAQFERSKQAGIQASEQNALDQGDMDSGAAVSDGEEDDANGYRLPISHEAALEAQGKLVCALDVEHSGQRVVAGSKDYTVRIFDFNGMKTDMRSFRSLEPQDGHPVHALSWSPSGDAFLAVTGSARIKVYDRDGRERGESLQGDMYIRDLRNTKGHVSPCTNGAWHPLDRYTGLTSSEDGTIRVWDTWNVLQKTVIKPTQNRPGRKSMTTCNYSLDGRLIVGGLSDGTLQLWDVRGKFGTAASTGTVAPPKPQMVAKQDWTYKSGGGQVVRDAHEPELEITGLCFAQDGRTFASRGADATLKLWDTRKLKAALHTFGDLPTNHSETNCCFSPDQRLVLTGTSALKDGSGSALHFFDVQKLQLVSSVGMATSVVAVKWHERTNQILLGTGDRNQGCVRVLYNPTLSEAGVLKCAARKPRAADPLDFQAPLVIHAPHALPMYRDDQHKRKRKSERDRDDAAKFRKPQAGQSAAQLGRGAGGNIGATGGTLLTQYVLKSQGLLKNPAEEDIRSAILRHGDAAKQEFGAHLKAYAQTQPKPVFAKDEEEEEDANKQ